MTRRTPPDWMPAVAGGLAGLGIFVCASSIPFRSVLLVEVGSLIGLSSGVSLLVSLAVWSVWSTLARRLPSREAFARFLRKLAVGSLGLALGSTVVVGVGALAGGPGLAYVLLVTLFQAAVAGLLLGALALVRPRRRRRRLSRARVLGSLGVSRALRRGGRQ